MKNRILLLVFAVVSFSMLLGACGDSATPDGGGKTITMWTFAQNNADEWTARKADIEKKLNITLNIQLVAQDAFVEKLQGAMMTGKDVPDMIEWMIENNRILASNPKDCFVYPLDEFVKDSATFKKVVPGRVAWVTYGGHVYGLPHDVHPVVLIYNDTLWKEVGVDVATIKTWDEFFEASKKLTAKKENGKPVHYALPYSNNGLQTTMFMIWQQSGAQILDASGKPTFTDPQFKAFAKKWAEWVNTGAFTEWDWGKFGAMLKNGALASYTSPDWWVSQVTEAANEGTYKFKVRDLPVVSAGGSTSASWGGSFLAIPKAHKDPASIYKIMEYMQYDKSAITARYETSGMLAPMSEIWDNDVFKQPDARFGGQKLGELQVSQARAMPEVVSGDIFWDAINDFTEFYQTYYAGEITLDEALQKTQAAATKRLK
ncbi:MAG: extracellular solute-binding protein [Spirochaetales bacterium]|nr:extracellular solute-binding protein [Spirochaetales bacterium]